MKRILTILAEKWPEYLLEILVLIIGIYGAFALNNWNEGRKEKALEENVLIELKKSLEKNSAVMLRDLESKSKWNQSSDIIIQALEKKVSYSDSLHIHFQNARKPGTNLSLSAAGYEALKDAGYTIIRSDKLRNSIVELFELTHKSLLEEMEYFEAFQPDRQRLVDELFSYDHEKFQPSQIFDVPLIPHDYEQLLKSRLYLSVIKSVKVQRNIIAVILEKHLEQSQEVLQQINRELEDRF